MNNYLKNVLSKISHQNHQVSRDLYEYAKTRIPGGTQLLSKRPEMFLPDQWPAYFSRAKGCECWDLDGNHYYDMTSNGIGACLLGFADPDVSEAVKRRIDDGAMCTLNPPEEVKLADMLCEIHPWASQVRFTRTGGETGAVAVRIARATTKRSIIAVCGYHGWQDWYLAANLGDTDSLSGHLLPGLAPDGVPRELKGTALTFKYNDMQQFADIIARYGDRLAAVVMEPCRYHNPQPGFMEFVREQTHACGAMLIFDEITIGWRLCFGGSHLKLGVNPDIAFFAKALGNGHPMGAVVGTKEAMEGAHQSFISSTYWTESVGPVAAIATLEKMKKLDIPSHVAVIGTEVMELWRSCGAKHGLNVSTDGYPCLAHFKFEDQHADELSTAYTQLMLDRGFLAKTMLYPTLAHTRNHVELYGKAIDEVFGILAQSLKNNQLLSLLKGPVTHKGFARLN